MNETTNIQPQCLGAAHCKVEAKGAALVTVYYCHTCKMIWDDWGGGAGADGAYDNPPLKGDDFDN